MENLIVDIFYTSLTSIVPKTLAILVPLAGAFWIFKVREKTASEGKIFEFGREISNIIQSKEVRGPIDGIAYSYIDEGLHKIEEKNRDKAITELLRQSLQYNMFQKKELEGGEANAASIIVAIAADRLNSLVPVTVKWTGKGSCYSSYGENIDLKDNFFPFGTKLYRQWIGRFSGVYNDLWAITNSRSFFVDEFLKPYKDTGFDKEKMGVWLDEIECRIKEIHPYHAKLLTQTQIIDTQIDLPRLARDIGVMGVYSLTLSCSGYFIPKFIYLSGHISVGNFSAILLATLLSYFLIGIRVLSAVRPLREKHSQRKIFLPQLVDDLSLMKKRCMRYKPHTINNILSLDEDLKLSSKIKEDLSVLIEKIGIFNEYAAILYKNVESILVDLKDEFPSLEKNQSGFSIEILDLANNDFDLEKIKSRIMEADENLIFSYQEIQLSRNIRVINLSELERKKRVNLCNSLDKLRSDILSMPVYISAIIALNEMQSYRESTLLNIEKAYNKPLNGDGDKAAAH
jgi:hypothetical protein